jgi:hypothetical protein
MLRHKAYIQCARMAFGISEVVDNDEADRISGGQTSAAEEKKESVNFADIESVLSECATIEDLDEACKLIRLDLDGKGLFKEVSSKLSRIKAIHKSRIEKMIGDDGEAEYTEVNDNESTEDSLSEQLTDEFGDKVNENEDVPFE